MIAEEVHEVVLSRRMAHEVNRAFGLAVIAIRKRRRMSQRALAEAAGMSRTYLANIEAGKSDPTTKSQQRIADALGTTVFRLWERAIQENRTHVAESLDAPDSGGGEGESPPE